MAEWEASPKSRAQIDSRAMFSLFISLMISRKESLVVEPPIPIGSPIVVVCIGLAMMLVMLERW